MDFWFDFSCPYAYVASTRIAELRQATGSDVRWQPFLLGGVFRHLQQAQNLSTTLSAPKARHNRLDLIRQAAWHGVPLRTPLRHPNRTIEALRALLACPAERWPDVAASFYRLYWAEAGDIADPAVLRQRLDALGLDGAAILERAATPEIKADLQARTDRAIATGVFGAPSFVVGDQLFWGQDRIEMVVRAAHGWRPEDEHADFQF